jgi:hypothetical protein
LVVDQEEAHRLSVRMSRGCESLRGIAQRMLDTVDTILPTYTQTAHDMAGHIPLPSLAVLGRNGPAIATAPYEFQAEGTLRWENNTHSREAQLRLYVEQKASYFTSHGRLTIVSDALEACTFKAHDALWSLVHEVHTMDRTQYAALRETITNYQESSHNLCESASVLFKVLGSRKQRMLSGVQDIKIFCILLRRAQKVGPSVPLIDWSL